MTQYSVVLSFKYSDVRFRMHASSMEEARKTADKICELADECINPSYSVTIESEDDADVME